MDSNKIKEMNTSLNNMINEQLNKYNYTETNKKVRDYIGKKSDSKTLDDLEFKKHINFESSSISEAEITHKLDTIYDIMKKEAIRFTEDGYLDVNETKDLFSMILEFSRKSLECQKNIESEEGFDKIQSIFNKTANLVNKALQIGIKGCYDKSKEYRNIANTLTPMNKWTFVKKYIFWNIKVSPTKMMDKKTGTMLNIIEFATGIFLISKPILAASALLSYKKELEIFESSKDSYLTLAKIEMKRAENFEQINQK